MEVGVITEELRKDYGRITEEIRKKSKWYNL